MEVCVTALKIRRAYLLSETGGAEDIAAHQDGWTYAVFLAALCHDLAKVAVDQTVTLYVLNHLEQTWLHFMDVQGLIYRLYEHATPVLIHKPFRFIKNGHCLAAFITGWRITFKLKRRDR